ncbi:MAG: TolC family protein [Cyclobacteriaceae bacterium]|nr:TolC family protein [Cyclobacteriaceae bacterium]
MKIKASLFLVAFLAVNITFGQQIDYNKIIIPKNVVEVDFVERLVQLAWQNHPENRMVENEYLMARQDVIISRWSWLDNIRATFNANEYTIDPSLSAGTNFFYPKYNFSFGIDFGMFVGTPAATKKAKINTEIQSSKINLQKVKIRTDVLSRYEEYNYRSEVLKIETDITEDIYAQFLVGEQDFKNGVIEVDDYLKIKSHYYNQVKTKLRSNADYKISKIQLEEMIGVKLEDL